VAFTSDKSESLVLFLLPHLNDVFSQWRLSIKNRRQSPYRIKQVVVGSIPITRPIFLGMKKPPDIMPEGFCFPDVH